MQFPYTGFTVDILFIAEWLWDQDKSTTCGINDDLKPQQ